MANSLHWFRKGLRVHDNQPLRDAIQGSKTFRGVFFLDRATVRNAKVSVNRWRFLLECLKNLDNKLKEFGTRLYIIQGHPIDVFPRLIKEWGITRLTFEYDSEPYPSQRDLAVRRLAENEGVEVIIKTSHSLFDISRFLEENDGQAPITFKQFHALLRKVGLPEACVETVDKELFGSCVMPVEDDHDEKYGIPSFEELELPVMEEKGLGVWTGGESQALNIFQMTVKELLKSNKEDSNDSEDSPFPKSTKLSPYLRFGCISPRLVFHEMTKLASKVSDPAACIGIQKSLLWREFFFVIASKNPALDKMCNNCMCLQFPWDKNNNALERWKNGKTGFPWIDAIMRQLRQEGWIHHLARQAVGCFLTRGCLWVSWEEGFKAFEEMQLDAEWSLNACCWLWLSCSAFFNSNPTPWFCPVNFGKKLDPAGNYVRKYVPEVKNLPTEYIFEPWLASAEVQRKAGCIIGVDYPQNILDHDLARKICTTRMRDVYSGLVVKVSCAPGLGHNVVHWFRKDLRLHDNPALWEALPNCRSFYAVYIFDPVNIKAAKVSANRWNFLLECLRDLDDNLKKCGTRLHVLRGQPTTIFPKLFREWNITKLTLESECEPFGQQRDDAIASLAEEYGVEISSRSSHTLYSIDKILEMNGGKCPTLFKEFESIIRKLGPPDSPVDPVNRKSFSSCICPVNSAHDEKYGVPTLSELNIDQSQVTSGNLWVGGETEALTRLTELEEKIFIGTKKESPESAAALLPSRTQLSPYLRFGCLSPKLYYKRLTMAYIKMKRKPPPMSLYCQLVWREFFFTLASKNPNMDTIENNPLCLEIDWEHNESALNCWKEGKTGFPWIDAIMRQLRQEGWIHHIARQAVGCFLTRGCLWISWEEGFKVFEELQLDAEWSVNSGSWLWLSCSAFFHSQIPWFCPVSVGKKLDPSGNYIRKYIPELRTMPNKYIYHPWTAPEGVQNAANCVVGKDYPRPIADYVERRKVCLQRLKEVCYQIKTTSESAVHTTAIV